MFGYGSLVWRPGHRVSRAAGRTRPGLGAAVLAGLARPSRVPHAPGRVVTLVPDPDASCEGVAYFVDDSVAEATFAGLDHREKNGYERHPVRLEFRDGDACDGVVYIAPAGNRAWLGPAPMDDMVEQIRRSAGPSGANIDYLRELAAALRELAIDDPHVFTLERRALEAEDAA